MSENTKIIKKYIDIKQFECQYIENKEEKPNKIKGIIPSQNQRADEVRGVSNLGSGGKVQWVIQHSNLNLRNGGQVQWILRLQFDYLESREEFTQMKMIVRRYGPKQS